MDTDHDKGLISSSSPSSSTLPTPPSLPEELRSKIVALGNTSSTLLNPYKFFPNLLEPVKCIDPDDPSSWIDQDGSFLSDIRLLRLFSPNQLPLLPGFEIDGEPVFELYRIEITKLDPLQNFSSIYMEGTNTWHEPVIIYKQPEGEEDIPLHQPLPLQNIFRPPSAENDVTVALSNPAGSGWALRYGPPLFHPENMEYGPRMKVVTDKFTELEALIYYELLESTAVAELEFTFLADRNHPIKIFCGSITATTNEDSFTERIIQQFSSEPSVLQTNVPIPVNRSVFGVPLGKSLYIHVTFEVAVGRISKTIGETIELSVPNETKSEEKYITIIKDKGIMMRVQVSWWDFMV